MGDDRSTDMSPKREENGLTRLLAIMARLRSPDGCPWDRKQTMRDLKVYLIDEAYEVLDAIDSGDRRLLREELGDLIFLIIFLAQLAQEEGAFDMEDIIRGIEKKMTRRHPHVFGDTRVSNANDVVDQWQSIKAEEGKPPRTSALSGVPETLPALYRTYRLGLRAGRVGFDWRGPQDVLDKVREELAEVAHELHHGNTENAAREVGDLLFALANLARHLNRDPEGLLRETNRKFVTRFHWLEDALKKQGLTPSQVTLEEMDRLWEEAKARELESAEGSCSDPHDSRGHFRDDE